MRHGFLLIAKPEGPTSHDVVAEVRRVLSEPAIGHLGTLDPLASGLLVLAVGKKALKVIELFEHAEKSYEARIVFGKVSATYDREGPVEEVVPKPGWSPPTETILRERLEQHFVGKITQTPPKHSAVHIEGKRAYELVRGDPLSNVLLPERQVTIRSIQLISYGYPHACLRIDCSSGTYIRSLANDLGALLRCGAYLASLQRLRVGSWRLEDSTTPEEVTWAKVQPLKDILTAFPRSDLTAAEWADVRNGRMILRRVEEEPLIAWFEGLPVALLERGEGGKAHPRKVL